MNTVEEIEGNRGTERGDHRNKLLERVLNLVLRKKSAIPYRTKKKGCRARLQPPEGGRDIEPLQVGKA